MSDQAKKHIVVLALSDLKSYRNEPDAPHSYSYEVSGFEGMDLPTHYTAWHTNEAPIKLLIDLAIRQNQPISRIVYLCSDLCRSNEVKIGTQATTAEKYFKQTVRDYLEERGATEWLHSEVDFFVPIEYDLEGPEGSLRDIIDSIGHSAVVDVDVSGAQRDAQLLVSHAIEFIQTATVGENSVELGTTVYAQLDIKNAKGTLANQRATYDLSGLINAVSAFTRYGRAGMLASFFGSTGDTAASRLCLAMRDFSDDLLLCRMGHIPTHVSAIHTRLDEFEQFASANEDLSGAEILLASLIPTIREGFVTPTAGEPEQQIIEIIRWCVDRRMLQQALSLYRERAPQILVARGYLNSESGAEGEEFIASLHDFCEAFIDSLEAFVGDCGDGKEKRARSRACRRITFADGKSRANLSAVAGKEGVLAANLVWNYFLRTIRNDTMHAKATPETEHRRRLLRNSIAAFENSEGILLGYDSALGIGSHACNKALATDIHNALDALEGKTDLRICDDLSGIASMSPAEVHEAVTRRNEVADSCISEMYRVDER